MNKTARNIVPAYSVVRDMKHIAHVKISAGQVEGDRHDITAGIHFFAELPADALNDKAVQLPDLPAFLQNADKIGWLQKTVLRVNPSRQSFHTAQTAGDGADDRLVINLNPSVFNGCVDIVADVGTHAHLTSHFAAVDLYKGVTAVPDAVAGNFCVIAGGTGGDIIVVRCRIYAAAVVDTSVTQVKDLLMRLLNPFHQIFFF